MQNDIFGTAISTYYKTKEEQIIKVKSDDFEEDEILVSYLFRDYSNMPTLEKKALQLCYGKVLDVGAGAGSHALYLQNQKKLEVTALDISNGAIEICQLRGVKKCVSGDFYQHHQKYDTILMLMNGSGIIGKLDGFQKFFEHLKKILLPNGQVLIDSSDLIYLFQEENGEYWIDASKGYYGEMKYQIGFEKKYSASFDWLYVDYNTLQRACWYHGFECELILEGAHYDYLAKLNFKK